jgi:PAS domain S-box-containing protein
VTVAAVVWTALVLVAGAWLTHTAVAHRRAEQVDAAAHRLDSAHRTLTASLQQLTVLPRALSRQNGILQFLQDTRLARSDRLSVEQRQQVQSMAQDAPGVLQLSRLLKDTADDFGLSALFLTDSYGTALADSNHELADNAIGRSFRGRRYYIDALDNTSGLGHQFAVSQVASGPALFFSSRVGSPDAPLGVVVVMQYSRHFSPMFEDPQRRLFVTDEHGVIVMAPNIQVPLQRTPLASTGKLPEEQAQRLYSRLPETLDWRLERINVGNQQVLLVHDAGQRYLALSRPLDGMNLTAWILVPLAGEAQLIAGMLALTALVLFAGHGVLALIGQRIRRQAVITRAQRELEHMAHALPLTVFCYRQPAQGAGRFSFLGDGAAALLGMDQGDILANPERVWERMGGEPHEQPLPPQKATDFAVDTPRGRRWLRCDSQCTVSTDGGRVYNGYWMDITARKQVEARSQAVFTNAPIAFLFFNAEQGITRCNPSAVRLFAGDSEQALLGLDLTRPPLSPAHAHDTVLQARVEAAVTAREALTFEWRHTRLDGEPFDAEVVLVPFEFEQRMQLCAIIQDISARKRAEAAQQSAQQAAEAATRAKTHFLANMSHEIRTPMNAIMGMTHLALMDELPSKARGYIDKAHRAATALLQILNDVLDVSKIESGKLELETTPFQLEDVVRHMAEVLGVRAEEKGLELLFTAPPDIPTALIGDPTRLGQILINLGTNAIKFTQKGEILIGCEVQRVDAHEVLLHFWVRDSGIGMRHDQIEQLFEPFTQADSSTTREYGGTGLGLTISRQLVELMRGRIWANSQPGKGSTFHFTARFGLQSQPQARRALMASELQGKRVLLVDDNATAREVLGDMAHRLGLSVETCDGGETALTKMRQASSEGRPHDIILTDWRMPGMDGIAFARAALALPPEQRPCVLLVTAFGREEAMQAAQGVGLAGVINKPVTPSTLFDTLSRVLGKDEAPPSAAPESTRILEQAREQLAGARVLLVEDQPMNQELARDLLERVGMTVVTANNGEEALRQLDDNGPFDGVLMDCQMPVLDGYSATERIRERPEWQGLPVIAMTASAMATDRDRVLRSGMNDHITKPLDLGRMFSIMARWIRPSRPGDALALPEAAAPEAPGTDTLDTADGMARCMGNLDLYSRLLRGFARTQRDFGALFDACGSREQAQLLTHTLKGLAGNIGARQLHAHCHTLEQKLIALAQATDASDWREACQAERRAAVAALDSVLHEIDRMQQPDATRQQALQATLGNAELTPHWATLRTLLSDHDAHARDLLQELLDRWPALLDEPHVQVLRQALEQYDFDAAEAALTKLTSANR